MIFILTAIFSLISLICIVVHIFAYCKKIITNLSIWQKIAGITCLSVVITQFILALLYTLNGQNGFLNAFVSILWFIDYVFHYKNKM